VHDNLTSFDVLADVGGGEAPMGVDGLEHEDRDQEVCYQLTRRCSRTHTS
jgi:hypothetical protein